MNEEYTNILHLLRIEFFETFQRMGHIIKGYEGSEAGPFIHVAEDINLIRLVESSSSARSSHYLQRAAQVLQDSLGRN
jgi:hypothetical protein